VRHGRQVAECLQGRVHVAGVGYVLEADEPGARALGFLVLATASATATVTPACLLPAGQRLERSAEEFVVAPAAPWVAHGIAVRQLCGRKSKVM